MVACFTSKHNQDIRIEMVEELLGDSYHILPLDVAPSDLGLNGVARSRKYIFCHHKATCRYLFSLHSAYSEICNKLQQYIHTEPKDYCVASACQVKYDAMQVASVRSLDYDSDTC